jgi:HSP20 family protein
MNNFLYDEESKTKTTTAPTADLVVKKNTISSPAPTQEGHLTVDVFKEANFIIVQATIAGTDPKDIDIYITKDSVTIKGSRENQSTVSKSNYYHQELYWGSFSRSIILPVDIDPDSSKAAIKNGVLIIRLPRRAKAKIKIDD